MKRSLSLCFILLALCVLPACKPSNPAPPSLVAPSPCTLNVGWDPWEPYQYEASDGSVRGLDIEIVGLLAADIGCGVTYTRGNWIDLLQKIRDAQLDILLAASSTPDREAYAWFSRPYRSESFVLMTRADDKRAGNESLDTLARTLKIGITEGYYYGPVVSELIYGEATKNAFVTAPVAELNYMRLVQNEVDALLDDPIVATAILRRKGLADQVTRQPQPINSSPVSLMLSKSRISAEQLEKLNAALAARQADGSLDRLIAKYRG